MNRQQARRFAIISTAVVIVAFLGMTVDSHRQFPRLTNEDKLTPQVVAGKDVWHKYNCTNCHTLLGEGAYYAPDLTKIALQRGPEYLRAFMQDPSLFYDEQKVRRVMPKQNLSEQEITDLIVFLDWIGHVDTQGGHFLMLLAAGTLFAIGVGLFIWNFFRYRPTFDRIVAESEPSPTPNAIGKGFR